MVRTVHIFDIKPSVVEKSFIEWLDGVLWEKSKKFGCIERKTWIFLDGIEGTYERPKAIKRPRYLNEAFWPSQDTADAFRKWLMSDEAKDFHQKWFSGIEDHTVLRYVDYHPPSAVGEE